MKKWNVIYYSLLLLFYIVFSLIFINILVLFFGVADFYLVLTFGLVNTLLSILFYKINFFKSILIGFFISGTAYLFSYVLLIFLLILSFSTSSYILILPLLFYVIAQTFLWMPLQSSLKIFNVRTISTMVISTVIALFVSLNLWDYWKYEHIYKFHLKVPLTVKAVDSETGQALVGETLELIAQRQPLYGLMQFPTFAKNVTDQNGLVTFEIYKGNYYDGSVLNKKGYFQIRENQKIENDTIHIEVLIPDDCKNC
jgi:hypothetical protein